MRAITAVMMALLAAPALAAEPNRCIISVTPLSFGTTNALATSDVRSTATVTYNCTSSAPISIAIGRSNGGFDPRHMNHGGPPLFYTLYLDPAGTLVWGDGTGGSQVYRDPAPPPNVNVSVPVFAQMPAGQRQAKVGMYGDTLTVTISY